MAIFYKVDGIQPIGAVPEALTLDVLGLVSDSDIDLATIGQAQTINGLTITRTFFLETADSTARVNQVGDEEVSGPIAIQFYELSDGTTLALLGTMAQDGAPVFLAEEGWSRFGPGLISVTFGSGTQVVPGLWSDAGFTLPATKAPVRADDDPNTGTFFVVDWHPDGRLNPDTTVTVESIGQFTYTDTASGGSRNKVGKLHVGDVIDGKAVTSVNFFYADYRAQGEAAGSVRLNDGTVLTKTDNDEFASRFAMQFIQLEDGTNLATLGGASARNGKEHFFSILDEVVENGSGVASFHLGDKGRIITNNSWGSQNVVNMFDMGDDIIPQVATGAIAGRVFLDSDGDNTGQIAANGAAEAGVADRAVRLFTTDADGTATEVASTTTDGTGAYLFEDVTEGWYWINIAGDSEESFVTPGVGLSSDDSDALAKGGQLWSDGSANTGWVYITADQVVADVDAGVRSTVAPPEVTSAGDWLDRDGNGTLIDLDAFGATSAADLNQKLSEPEFLTATRTVTDPARFEIPEGFFLLSEGIYKQADGNTVWVDLTADGLGALSYGPASGETVVLFASKPDATGRRDYVIPTTANLFVSGEIPDDRELPSLPRYTGEVPAFYTEETTREESYDVPNPAYIGGTPGDAASFGTHGETLASRLTQLADAKDADGNGVIDADEAESLAIWTDDGDGVLEAYEVESLAANQIETLSLPETSETPVEAVAPDTILSVMENSGFTQDFDSAASQVLSTSGSERLIDLNAVGAASANSTEFISYRGPGPLTDIGNDFSTGQTGSFVDVTGKTITWTASPRDGVYDISPNYARLQDLGLQSDGIAFDGVMMTGLGQPLDTDVRLDFSDPVIGLVVRVALDHQVANLGLVQFQINGTMVNLEDWVRDGKIVLDGGVTRGNDLEMAHADESAKVIFTVPVERIKVFHTSAQYDFTFVDFAVDRNFDYRAKGVEADGAIYTDDQSFLTTDTFMTREDANRDGKVSDAELDNVAIWSDDGDGRLEAGEFTVVDGQALTLKTSSTGGIEAQSNLEANGQVSYSLDGTDAALFQINAATGQLGLADGFTPDFDAPQDANGDNAYDFAVLRSVAGDAQGALVELTREQVQLTITDVMGTGAITGRVFAETNGEAGFDGTDFALNQRTVVLVQNGVRVDERATVADGTYSFDAVEAGDYRVVVLPIGGAAFADGENANDVTVTDGGTQIVDEALRFSDTPTRARVTTDADVVIDMFTHTRLSADAELAGQVAYSLSGEDASRFAVDANTGVVRLAEGLNPGTYSIVVERDGGPLLEAPKEAVMIEIISPDTVVGGEITGRVFEDTRGTALEISGSGLADGLEGTLVALLDAGGNVVRGTDGDALTTLTDAFGGYGFGDLEAGDYLVGFAKTEEFVFVEQGLDVNTDGRSDDPSTSDVNTSDTRSVTIDGIATALTLTDTFTLSNAEILRDVDAGLISAKRTGSVDGDTLNGTDQVDRLFGEDGDDVLNGGAGRDVLDGGNGKDVLTGGADQDVFIFRKGSGETRITDFQLGFDFLDVEGFFEFFNDESFYSFGRQVESNAVFTFGTDILILENTTFAMLSNGDLCMY